MLRVNNQVKRLWLCTLSRDSRHWSFISLIFSHFMCLAAVWYSSRSITRLRSKMQNVQRYTLYWLSPSICLRLPLCAMFALDSHVNEETWDRDDALMPVIHSHEEMSPDQSHWMKGTCLVCFPRARRFKPCWVGEPRCALMHSRHYVLLLVPLYVEHRQLLSEQQDIILRHNIRLHIMWLLPIERHVLSF